MADDAIAAFDLGLARGNPLRRLLVGSKGRLVVAVMVHDGLLGSGSSRGLKIADEPSDRVIAHCSMPSSPAADPPTESLDHGWGGGRGADGRHHRPGAVPAQGGLIPTDKWRSTAVPAAV